MEDLKQFLDNWINPQKRDKQALKQLSLKYLNLEYEKCPKCESKAILNLMKFYEANKPQQDGSRQYVLKQGNHQFVSGDSKHNNENTTDAELAWYVQQYPHIRSLFIKIPN